MEATAAIRSTSRRAEKHLKTQLDHVLRFQDNQAIVAHSQVGKCVFQFEDHMLLRWDDFEKECAPLAGQGMCNWRHLRLLTWLMEVANFLENWNDFSKHRLPKSRKADISSCRFMPFQVCASCSFWNGLTLPSFLHHFKLHVLLQVASLPCSGYKMRMHCCHGTDTFNFDSIGQIANMKIQIILEYFRTIGYIIYRFFPRLRYLRPLQLYSNNFTPNILR